MTVKGVLRWIERREEGAPTNTPNTVLLIRNPSSRFMVEHSLILMTWMVYQVESTQSRLSEAKLTQRLN